MLYKYQRSGKSERVEKGIKVYGGGALVVLVQSTKTKLKSCTGGALAGTPVVTLKLMKNHTKCK